MKEVQIAKIYAKSFLEIGEENKIDMAQELISLTEVINMSNHLENVLFLDVFTIEEKTQVFNDIAKKISLSDVCRNCINFLLAEKRIGILPLIVKECVVIDDDKKGFMRGMIEGAEAEVTAGIKDQITKFLEGKVKKNIKLNYKQNLNMSAGYKVTAGDLQLDATLDTQLENFKQSVLLK